MSLNHHFLLVDKFKFISNQQQTPVLQQPDGKIYLIKQVRLHDNLVGYMLDSTRWVNTTSPHLQLQNGAPTQGLNRYGVTGFSGDNLKQFRVILQTWHSLFENAPAQFVLNGECAPVETEVCCHFRNFKVDKARFLAKLSSIIGICVQAEKQPDQKAMLHFGVQPNNSNHPKDKPIYHL